MEEVKIPITLDDSGFGTGAKRIIDRMEDTQKEVNKTGMSVDYFAKHMQNVYRHFDKLTAAVHENTAAIGKDSQATRQLGRDFDETANKGVSGFGRLEKAAIGFFTIQKAKEFVGNVYEVRSEIEKLETSFRILVGDKAKADALFASIRKFAVETPMQLKDLAGAVQTMMGFGIATEDVMANLEALGNVSMGDSQKFQSLALAFSQMSATGKLMGQDLLQMINAGFNPLDQMAKTTGKSIAELKEEMSQGAISADMVRQAFIDATSEGGKFNGMLEAQSKTLAGAYSNLEGAVDDMLNEIGQKSEGAFATAIEGATDLVKNYDKVASVIQDLIVAYGSYKAALMVCNAVEKASVGIKQAMAVQEALLTAEAKKLAAARGISLAAAKAELGGVNLLTVAKIRLTAATKSLTAAMMANPYVLVSMAVAGLCFGIYKLATAEDAETAARRRANEEMKTFQDQLDEQKNKIQGYIQALQDSNATEYQKAEAWEMLNKMAPTLTEKYDRATLATMDLAEANKELTEQAERQNYDHLREELAKWQKEVIRLKAALNSPITNIYEREHGGGVSQSELDAAQAKLDEYARKLAEIDRIRAKMAEDNKPLEIRIQEANENAEAKAEIYNFYKRAADLPGELKRAHDIAAGTIANSSIPQDYEAIADSARQKYDDLIAELEKDVEDLRTKIAGSPASLELERELKGKEQALNALLQMKREWAWSGATTIPLTFQWNFSQVEKALRDAQSGAGKNTDGMKWVTDYVSQAGGHWEKDEAHADTRTAAQWRQQAYGNWKKAQKAVDEFWQKKESMDKASFDKEYDRLKGIADKAKKDYDKLKGSKGGNTNKKDPAVERAKKQQEYLALIEQQRVEQERAVKDMEYSTTQATIDLLQDGTEKTLAQLKLDFERQETEIVRGYEDLKQAKIDAARRLFESDPGNKDEVFDPTKVDTSYSKAESDNYEAQLAANQAAYDRALAAQRKSQEQHLLDYIRTYGSIQDQRAAIAKTYEQKIADEQDAIQKKALEAERDRLLSELDLKELQESIDWESVFGDLSRQSTSALRDLKSKLREALDAKDISIENAKILSEKILEIEDTLTGRTDVLSSILPGLRERKRLTEEAAAAEELYRKAVESEAAWTSKVLSDKQQIKDLLDTAEIRDAFGEKITVELEAISEENKDRLLSSLDKGSDLYKQLLQLFENLAADTTSQNKNRESKEKRRSQADALKGSLSDGTFKRFMKDLFNFKGMDFMEITSLVNSNVQSLAEFTDKIGLAGTDFGDAVHGFADGVGGFSNALQSLSSGDVFGAVNGVLDGVAGFARMGVSIFAGGGNEERLEKEIAELSESQKTLADAIEYFAGKIKDDSATNAESIEYYQKALAAERDWREKQQQKIDDRASEYANSGYGFLHLGGKSSFNSKMAGDEWEGWQIFSRILSTHIGESGVTHIGVDRDNIWDLSPEEMELLKNFAPKEWANLFSGDGHRNPEELVEEYITHSGKLEEYISSLNEKLTGYTWDGFLDSYKSLLKDLDSTTEDFADHINELITNALVESFVNSEAIQGKIRDLYALIAAYAGTDSEGGTDLTEGEIADIRRANEAIANTTLEWRESMKKAGLIKDTGAATDDAVKYFEDLRDMWLSTLTDMEADGASWQADITRIMVEDLINSLVLGDEFEEWLADWKERYAEEMARGGDTDRLKALIDEMVAERKELAVQAQGIMDDLGYTDLMKEVEASADVFEDLHDNFLSALMDMDTDAEEWGKKIGETLARQMIEQQLLNQAFDGFLDEWKSAVSELVHDGFVQDGDDEQTLGMLRGKIAEIVEKYKELAPLAQEFLEALGLVESSNPETPFKNLRQTFLNALTDMKSDAESFRSELDKTLVQDMLEKFVFDVELTVNGQAFENFDAYLEDWNRRYLEILENGELTQLQKESQLQALIDELAGEREALDAASSDLRERLKEPDSTFTSLSDGWVSTLLDMEATAEDWAEETGRTMARKIVEQMMVTSMIQPLLDQLQEAFNEAMSRAGATWESVLPELAPYIDEVKGAFGEMQPMVEQILNALGIFKETVTDDTMTSMRDSWLSALMDMENDTEDFAADISKLLTEAFIDRFVLGDEFDKRLAEWQEQYASIMRGNYSEEERASLLKQLQQAIAAAKEGYAEEAQAIHDLLGTGQSSDQTATMNMADKATYDQFETYLGIAVAQQMATLQGNEVRQQILATLRGMTGITSPGGDTVKEIRSLLNTSNEYLLDIKRTNRAILDRFGVKIDTIISKLTRLV